MIKKYKEYHSELDRIKAEQEMLRETEKQKELERLRRLQLVEEAKKTKDQIGKIDKLNRKYGQVGRKYGTSVFQNFETQRDMEAQSKNKLLEKIRNMQKKQDDRKNLAQRIQNMTKKAVQKP